MDTISGKPRDAVNKFWDRYLQILRNHKVKEASLRWHVKRVEQYIAHFPDHKLARHSPQQVTDYFTGLSRDTTLDDWQFTQTVDAIRLLFCDLLTVVWCQEVDWSYWLDNSHGISTKHATLAREVIAGSDPYKEMRRCPTSEVRARYHAPIEQLVTAIRLRAYSITSARVRSLIYDCSPAMFEISANGYD